MGMTEIPQNMRESRKNGKKHAGLALECIALFDCYGAPQETINGQRILTNGIIVTSAVRKR